MKQVKEYHNVLQEPFFEIPIEQVQNLNFTTVCMLLNVVYKKYYVGVNARLTY